MPLDRIVSLIAPPLCFACGAGCGEREALCAGCHSRLRWLGPELHEVAGVPLWAPLAYDGPARALVSALKYRAALRLAEAMAAQIVAGAPACLPIAGRPLVPAPMPAARRRRRGFNQAEVLATALSRRTGGRVCPCLARTPRSAPQVGRGRDERLIAMGDAVGVETGGRPPAEAVLVDDVLTTGATLAACVRALRRAGRTPRAALVYARTPGR